MAWNRNVEKAASPQPKKPSPLRGVVAGALVVMLAAGGYFAFFAGGPEPTRTSKDRAQRAINDKGKKASSNEIAEMKDERAAAVAKECLSGQSRTSDDGLEAQSQADTNGANAELVKPKKKRVFETGTDQLIAMAMSAPPGTQMPPLPGIGAGDNREFLESLKRPIKIEEDDSDHIKAVKEMVQNTREEIVKLMEENPNMAFTDILQEHRKIHNEDATTRSQVIQELQKIIDEGDVEGAKKFRMTMNFALQQMGIDEIDTPITEEEKAAAAEREEAEAQVK